MKTRIFIISILLMCAMITSGQSFYYYKGTKVPLQQDIERVSVISPKSDTNARISGTLRNIYQDQIINDANFDIITYRSIVTTKSPDSGTLEVTLRNAMAGNVIILPTYKNMNGEELVMTNYLNIKLKKENDYQTLVSIAKKYNLEIVNQNEFMPLWYSLSITSQSPGNTLEIANAIFETGLFASSSPDLTNDALECSYDPLFSSQWGLYNSSYTDIDISACAAWNYSTGRGIKIAIIDAGIELTHQDLIANLYPLSYDTETSTSPGKLYDDHGTHCAGIAAAVQNNGIQISGVAPDAKLMAVSNRLGGGSNMVRNLANGINWAWQNGADIISCSWRCDPNDILEEAIDNALFKGREGRGAIFIKSAGNTGGAISYPGYYRPEVFAVGNIQSDGTKHSTSSYGSALDVVAPGTNILSTLNNNKSGYNTGTSMAAPHAAGIAALILSRNPSLTGQQVRDIIESNTKKVGDVSYSIVSGRPNGTWNEKYGYGLINAYQAVINTPRY